MFDYLFYINLINSFQSVYNQFFHRYYITQKLIRWIELYFFKHKVCNTHVWVVHTLHIGPYYYYCENCAQLSGKNIKRKQNILFEICRYKIMLFYLHLCSLYTALRPVLEKGFFFKRVSCCFPRLHRPCNSTRPIDTMWMRQDTKKLLIVRKNLKEHYTYNVLLDVPIDTT